PGQARLERALRSIPAELWAVPPLPAPGLLRERAAVPPGVPNKGNPQVGRSSVQRAPPSKEGSVTSREDSKPPPGSGAGAASARESALLLPSPPPSRPASSCSSGPAPGDASPGIVEGRCRLCGCGLGVSPWGNPRCRGCSAVEVVRLEHHPLRPLLLDWPAGFHRLPTNVCAARLHRAGQAHAAAYAARGQVPRARGRRPDRVGPRLRAGQRPVGPQALAAAELGWRQPGHLGPALRFGRSRAAEPPRPLLSLRRALERQDFPVRRASPDLHRIRPPPAPPHSPPLILSLCLRFVGCGMRCPGHWLWPCRAKSCLKVTAPAPDGATMAQVHFVGNAAAWLAASFLAQCAGLPSYTLFISCPFLLPEGDGI
ncbi:unnamed protein product, partial [Prorocentrum cordatum]